MNNAPITCACGRDIKASDENSLRYGECFHCRIQGTGFTFRGGGSYGREAFSARTNAEFLRENDGAGTVSARYGVA